LLAVGQLSNSLTAYAIDPDSGALRALERYPVGNNPNWIEMALS
jgi:6-phosphogluconolactonase